MAAQRGKQVESDESYKRRVRLYARAVPGMHRAGPGERGGGSYGRRTVAMAERAAMQLQISGGREGVKKLYPRYIEYTAGMGSMRVQYPLAGAIFLRVVRGTRPRWHVACDVQPC